MHCDIAQLKRVPNVGNSSCYRDDTTHVIFEHEGIIVRLAALAPNSRAHLSRYHGVFAPASSDRARFVPRTCAAVSTKRARVTVGTGESVSNRQPTVPSARRLKRVSPLISRPSGRYIILVKPLNVVKPRAAESRFAFRSPQRMYQRNTSVWPAVLPTASVTIEHWPFLRNSHSMDNFSTASRKAVSLEYSLGSVYNCRDQYSRTGW